MTKIYNAEQQQFIRDARSEYCEYASEIDKQKQYTKEDKETGKSIKLGFKLFYNETKDEQLSITENAAFIAEMGEDN